MLALLKWDEREPYEKIIMAGLGAAILLALLWLVLISPILSAKKDAESQTNRALRDSKIVNQAAPILGQAKTTSAGSFTQATLIDLARKNSVKLSRVQPDKDAVLVWMDDIEALKLYGFLNILVVEGGAEIMRAVISTGDDGLLSAQFTLK